MTQRMLRHQGGINRGIAGSLNSHSGSRIMGHPPQQEQTVEWGAWTSVPPLWCEGGGTPAGQLIKWGLPKQEMEMKSRVS